VAVEIARLMAVVGADTGDFEQKMGKAESTISRFAEVGKKALLGATAVMGTAIAGFAAKSVSVAADFEAQMNILAMAARSSGTSLEELSTAAIQVGADTELVGISASEAADAMTNFYKAGLDTTDIFGDLNAYLNEGASLSGALRAAIDLAAASELDLATASDVVSVAMNTFGLNADDATRIANSFVQAADASVTSVSGLAEAMVNVGPTLANFGWSLEEANTALAILSSRGIQGSEAGTALKSMMTNMMRQTDAVKEAWNELGVSMYDAEGQLRALPDVIADLNVAMAGLTEEQRNQYIQTLAGTYGMKALNTFLAEGKSGWDEMSEAIANAATAQETAGARTQGFQAAMEQLQGTIETLMIQVGTPLIENFLTPGVQLLTEWIGKLTELAPTADQVRGALESLKTGVAGFVTELQEFLADPLGFLRERWPEWQTTIQEAIGNAIGAAAEWLRTSAAPYALQLWEGLKAWVQQAFGQFTTNAASLGGDLGTSLGTALRAAISWMSNNVVPLAQELWQQLQALWSQAVETFSQNAQSWGNNLGTWLGTALRYAIGFLVQVLPELATSLWEFLQDMTSSATSSDNSAVLGEALLTFFGAMLDGFMTALTDDPQWKTKFYTWANETIGEPIKNFLEWVNFIPEAEMAIQTLIDGINNKIEEVQTAIDDIVYNIVHPFEAIDLREIGANIIGGLRQGISDAASSVANAAESAAGSAVDKAKSLLGIGSPSKVFEDYGRSLMEGLQLGIQRESYRPTQAITNVSRDVTYHYTYNLAANYQGRPVDNLETLLRELTHELRRRGIAAPLPDVGMP